MDIKKYKQLDNRIELLSNSVDKRFEQVDKRFEQVDKRFEQVDKRFEQVITMLLNHEDRLERIETNMATKDDIRQINQTLDMLIKSNNDMKEDHLFGLRWQKRMQEQLDFHEEDLKRLKLVLHLA